MKMEKSFSMIVYPFALKFFDSWKDRQTGD